MIDPRRFGKEKLQRFGSTPHDWLNTGFIGFFLYLCSQNIHFG